MAELNRKGQILIRALIISACIMASSGALAASSWNGIDEAVVEKIAKEHGREAREPLIDPGSGDLLLFAFLAAGACGGFAAGYYWRELVEKKGR